MYMEKLLKEFDRHKFKYLDQLPQLVLATKIHHYHDPEFVFKNTKEFIPVAHQTAGHACHQHYMYATLLKPRKEIQDFMQKISDYWLDTDCGMFSVSLDEILEYRKQLQELGLDCTHSYLNFEEGIYPIDCSQFALNKLQEENISLELDDLIEWKNPMQRVCGSIRRWSLFILGENCD